MLSMLLSFVPSLQEDHGTERLSSAPGIHDFSPIEHGGSNHTPSVLLLAQQFHSCHFECMLRTALCEEGEYTTVVLNDRPI